MASGSFQSLSLFLTLVTLLVFSLFFGPGRIRRDYPGSGYWLSGIGLGSLAFLAFGLRGWIPDFISIFLGNTTVFISITLMIQGIAVYRKMNWPRILSLVVLILGVAVYSFFWNQGYGTRLRVSDSVLAGLWLIGIFGSVCGSDHPQRPVYMRLGIGFTLLAVLIMGRLFYNFSGREMGTSPDSASAGIFLAMIFALQYSTFLSFVLLITRRFEYQLEEDQKVLTDTKEQLERSNLLRERLISVIGHDLRGPVGSIREGLHYLASEGDKYDPKMVKLLQDTSDRTLRLLESLLVWSSERFRDNDTRLSTFPVKPVIEEAVELTRMHISEKNVTVLWEIPAGDLNIHFNRDVLFTVFRNLVSNAVKFSPPGSAIRMAAYYDKSHTMLEVHDKAGGILPEKLQMIRDRLPVKSSRGTRGELGSGFGLAMSMDLLERFGARMEVESEDGGSVFRIVIPHQKEA